MTVPVPFNKETSASQTLAMTPSACLADWINAISCFKVNDFQLLYLILSAFVLWMLLVPQVSRLKSENNHLKDRHVAHLDESSTLRSERDAFFEAIKAHEQKQQALEQQLREKSGQLEEERESNIRSIAAFEAQIRKVNEQKEALESSQSKLHQAQLKVRLLSDPRDKHDRVEKGESFEPRMAAFHLLNRSFGSPWRVKTVEAGAAGYSVATSHLAFTVEDDVMIPYPTDDLTSHPLEDKKITVAFGVTVDAHRFAMYLAGLLFIKITIKSMPSAYLNGNLDISVSSCEAARLKAFLDTLTVAVRGDRVVFSNTRRDIDEVEAARRQRDSTVKRFYWWCPKMPVEVRATQDDGTQPGKKSNKCLEVVEIERRTVTSATDADCSTFVTIVPAGARSIHSIATQHCQQVAAHSSAQTHGRHPVTPTYYAMPMQVTVGILPQQRQSLGFGNLACDGHHPAAAAAASSPSGVVISTDGRNQPYAR